MITLLAVGSAKADAAAAGPSRPDELLVRFKAGAPAAMSARAHATRGAKVMRHYRAVSNLERVRLPPGTNVEDAVRDYSSDPNVLYAEPNYLLHAVALPNDPRFGETWGLHNVGQDGGVPDADIDAPEAWDITTGSDDVVVAVVDTGIDYNHADLAANMFRNEPECTPNGIDDDGNGYVDDCHGIDAIFGDGNPDAPRDDHGTHVAGTIGARGNDGIGVVGVNWRVKILSCKFLDLGSGDTADAIECLDYLAYMKDHGVNLVASNNSWGGTSFSQALYDAIDAQRARGILFITSAGNAGLEAPGFFPSSHYLPNMITVAASTRTDELAFFSNYGVTSVHLAAPGHQVLSTIPSGYAVFSGTSMAAPHVTGVAALLAAQSPGRDWRAIRNLILAGGDARPAFAGTTVTGRRLNAYGSLTCSGTTVQARLRPVRSDVYVPVGGSVDLATLHITCADPAGPVDVLVEPGGSAVSLADDGLGFDQEANDGVYSATWIAPAAGTYTLTFADGDVVAVHVGTDALVAPDPSEGAQFAWSLGADDSLVVAGEPNDDTGALDTGSAHVFDRLTAAPLLTLHDPTPADIDNFGYSVAIANGFVLVGAPGDSGDAGAAYVFDAASGALLHTLTSPLPSPGAQCGYSVAFVAGNALVGCPYDDALALDSGAVYVFDPASGALLSQLTNPSPAEEEFFGWSLAPSGTRLVVGAPGDGPAFVPGAHIGTAYLIDADLSSPGFGTVLHSFFDRIPGGGVPRFFGHAVAARGSDVIVGDPYAFTPAPPGWDGPGAVPGSGAAFVYDGDSGALRYLLIPPVPRNDMLFGWSVLGFGNRILVGAPLDPLVVAGGGALYEFEAATGAPLRADFSPSPGGGDLYGLSAAGSGTALFAGDPRDDTRGVDSGAAYRVADAGTGERSKCYRAKRAPGTPVLPQSQVTLSDGIESKLTRVLGLFNACNPASQSGSTIADANARLTCHKIKNSPGQAKLTPLDIRTLGPLGFERLTLKRAQSLCVPSGRNGGPIPGGVDRYKCYVAKTTRGVPRFAKRDIAVADEVETKLTTFLRPAAFCTPVSVEGGAVLSPAVSLTCYAVRDASGQAPFARPSFSATTFLGTEDVATIKASQVCVPSQRLPD